ncbi:P-loop NTPase fold protein [Ralstonia pseudosolanacearum]|uniref:KAP family P-loop NTPase fold protein n=1 Tax=Ralstonia pseudosolanacearum TaxID=1310165 RepID=UPI001FF9CB62|nr:P-loop NTPase fold protein [Ralstonia pseudosolanacearum]
MAASNDQNAEFGFDHPLNWKDALATDKLGRRSYAEAAVQALRRVSSTAGFVLSVEGAWGSGKTSTLAMMEALLRAQKTAPVIVHFNPWLVGDRDALLRHFISKIATEVKQADYAADGKKVARELKAYSKIFDFIGLVPGAEPWASLVKTVIESTGDAVDSVASYKTRDIETRKVKVEEALRRFGRPIIVFIDDIDRLFPLEVFEMVRIVKAVGDLPNVGYVLAWDSQYVCDALKAANVPRSETYLEKVVQVRLPLPTIGLEARRLLINEALSRQHPDANKSYFANSEDRLGLLYFSGLREILEQPRDYARVFNTVAAIEPALRGEVVLADIIGLAALMVKAPHVYELIRGEPHWFVGRLPGDHNRLKKTEELLKEGAVRREATFSQCSHPTAVRNLVHRLFPLTARADNEFSLGTVIDVEGHIAAPTRLLVALQLYVSGTDVSFVVARRYLVHLDQRSQITSSLTHQNCLEFLECLGDVVESTSAAGIENVERLCLDIARLADTEPFPARSKDRTEFFRLRAEDVAVRAIRLVVKTAAADRASAIAEHIVADPEAITVAMELFAGSYLVDSNDQEGLCCSADSKQDLAATLAENVLEAAKSAHLLKTCNPGYVLSRLSSAAPEVCPKILAAMKSVDPTLDDFALAMFSHSFDSTNGQSYSLPDDLSKIEAYCSLKKLKKHAQERLADPMLQLPALAAWRAVHENRSVYGVDGTYAEK